MGNHEVRARAIGLLESGSTHLHVAGVIGVSLPTVKRWWMSVELKNLLMMEREAEGLQFWKNAIS